ncbi:MAG: helix-turn-helix transcriptional regulator [Halobacteriovoraceae bacterium]|jgi:transcriptional regulator with XRE-family HTH domain|nr:helix-turn-helix transcriptional regulator [Halobacteriovoraceae bacterium]MBT5093053.1 helix-turn-helix transcriptional regulator [Halobacteriovoraceae bacterium]
MEIQLDQSLKKHLKDVGLTQNQLASKVGIRPSSFHAYLNGAIPRGLETIIKIASELNLSLDELVFNQRPVLNNQDIPISESVLLGLLGKYELVISKKSEV